MDWQRFAAQPYFISLRLLNIESTPPIADADCYVQGEYEGETSGKEKLGAQVVALGDGRFDVYLLKGGLPGAGCDAMNQVKFTALSADGKTALTAADHAGWIAAGKLDVIRSPYGSFLLSNGGTSKPHARCESASRRPDPVRWQQRG